MTLADGFFFRGCCKDLVRLFRYGVSVGFFGLLVLKNFLEGFLVLILFGVVVIDIRVLFFYSSFFWNLFSVMRAVSFLG